MSRVVKYIDNNLEFLWSLSDECYGLKIYKTSEELIVDMDTYIYFYNNERFQEQRPSPLEMENKTTT